MLRRAVEHLNSSGEFASNCFDPEVTWRTRPDGPTNRTYEGFEEISQGLGLLREAWGRSIRMEVLETTEVPDGLVLLGRVHLEGDHSGVALEVEEGWLLRMRDGRIVRMEQYGTKREALAAAGLPGE